MDLAAKTRETTGKKVKKLRDNGEIPAVVFGNKVKPTNITLNSTDFIRLFDQAGETALIDLKIEGKNHKVMVKDVQYDPVSDEIIHVGLFKPDLTEKIEVQVPVEIVGDDTNELVKSGEGIVLVLMNEITVKALATDFPEAFVVDINELAEIGAGITIGELNYDREKVEIVDLEEDELVVKIDYAQMEEEPEEEVELTEEEAIAQMEATEETAEDTEEEISE